LILSWSSFFLSAKLGCSAAFWKLLGFLMDYLEELSNWVFRPSPGTPRHHEWRQRSCKAVNDERAKPVETRDPARLRRLRVWDLELRIEHFEVCTSAADFHGSIFRSAFSLFFSQTAGVCRRCAWCRSTLLRLTSLLCFAA
jgi:hypothetical protein